MKLSVTKTFPSGAYEIYAIVKGEFIRRVYFGYTRREAVAMFKANPFPLTPHKRKKILVEQS